MEREPASQKIAVASDCDPSKLVAIVVPLSSRPELTPDEAISLRHLEYFLGGYDRFFLAARGMDVPARTDFGVKWFDAKYFGSASAHALLQLSAEFFESFAEYKFILMYHLDALAFSDQLREWCSKDFDFIGAPWIPSEENFWLKEPEVGNSGFALFKVSSCRHVLTSRLKFRVPGEEWRRLLNAGSARQRAASALRFLKSAMPFGNDVQEHVTHWLDRELPGDIFWAREAVRYYPAFRIAPVDEALAFAFETDPADCYRRNGGRLPFGCHAWARYDRGFWEPFLVDEGDAVAAKGNPVLD